MAKKNYSKTGQSCRVTFRLPSESVAQTAHLCGEFNGWDQTSHPLTQRKDGSFSLTVSLQPGQSYRYRYLLDGERWENDREADAYVPNEFGSDDSVVEV